jgi:hypothetical protein
MKPTVTLRKAFADKALLGKVLTGDSWRAWRTLMIASMGEALRDDERAIFTNLTGRATEPLQRVEELCAVIGRRGGKSRAMATLATYIGGLCDHNLVRGETGVVLLIAPDQRQANIALDYANAAFEQSPILRQLIANRSADTLELANGISIEVRAASFRRLPAQLTSPASPTKPRSGTRTNSAPTLTPKSSTPCAPVWRPQAGH